MDDDCWPAAKAMELLPKLLTDSPPAHLFTTEGSSPPLTCPVGDDDGDESSKFTLFKNIGSDCKMLSLKPASNSALKYEKIISTLDFLISFEITF